jgi:hypothetical protein
LWCDTPLVDAGSVEVLDERVHTVIIRFSGNAHRLGVVDVPRGRSDWWRVDVVAPTANDPADALLVLRIVVQPRIAGCFRDEVVVEAGNQRVVIEVACTAVVPTKTMWPTGIRRWCRIAAPALVLAAFVLPEMISREAAGGTIVLPPVLAPLLALTAAVLVGVHAMRTRGFSYGTGTDRGLAVALAVPGTAVVMLWVAVVVFAVAVLVIGLAVVGAVVAFAID